MLRIVTLGVFWTFWKYCDRFFEKLWPFWKYCDRFFEKLWLFWKYCDRFFEIVNCLFVFHCILWHSEMHCWPIFSLDLFSLHYYHFFFLSLLLCTVLMLIGTIHIVILLFSVYLFKYGSVLNWFVHELIPISERFVFSTYKFLLLLLLLWTVLMLIGTIHIVILFFSVQS